MFYKRNSGLKILNNILIFISVSAFLTFCQSGGPEKNILYSARLAKHIQQTKFERWPEKITDSTYGKIVIDSLEFSSNGTLKVYGWAFDHSVPRTDKSIGIWPRGKRRLDPVRLQQLTKKWGFTYLCYSPENMPDWSNFQNAGFITEKTMIEVSDQTKAQRKETIKLFPNAFAFYVDEPYGQSPDYPDRSMDSLKKFVDAFTHNSLTITSGYKRNAMLKSAADQSDKVFYSSYKHWRKFPWPAVWTSWPVNKDQRADWTDMKKIYGEKFNMTWIAAHRDFEEYDKLFEHAMKLSLDIIWFYQLEDARDDQSDENIKSFCYNASKNGYLKGYERYYYIEYRCINNSTVNKCDPGNPEHWERSKIYALNNFRILTEE